MTELVACEFEDSTNCVWNAQEQGNGEGNSFVDIDGTAFYVENATAITTLECPDGKVPGWLDENGNPQGCVDNNPTPLEQDGFYVDCETQMLHYYKGYWEGDEWIDTFIGEGTPASSGELYSYGCTDESGNNLWPVAPEIEVPEEITIQPEPVQVPDELAVTGTAEVVTGALVGIVLVVAGVVLYLKGRKK